MVTLGVIKNLERDITIDDLSEKYASEHPKDGETENPKEKLWKMFKIDFFKGMCFVFENL